MMFYTLAICVFLAGLFLVLAFALPASRALRRMAATMVRSRTPAAAANVLFAIRILPLFLALGVSLGLILPAFLRFEPRTTSEAMSARLFLLSFAGALVLTMLAVRGLRVLRATARVERGWRARGEEQRVNVAGSEIPVHYVDGAPALLAVTGFFRPRIFVAREVCRLLSRDELFAALAHEMAHVGFSDNFKQFLLRLTRLPRWLGGTAMEDAAWVTVSELAADEAALAGGASALDLASALVKMSALKTDRPVGSQVAASHLLPDLPGPALEMRVAHLHRLLEDEIAGPKVLPRPKPWPKLIAILLAMMAYVAAVSTLLPSIHKALEFLVR